MENVKMKIEDLNPALYNPRKPLQKNDPEYESLKKSMEEFGFVSPIVVNKRNRTVVGGHQRLIVLKDLGYTEVDCVLVDVDEQEERILNIGLNKVKGEFDMEKLEDLFKDLDGKEKDLTVTGFDMGAIDELIGNFDPLAEEEESAAPKEENKMLICPSCKYEAGKEEFTH